MIAAVLSALAVRQSDAATLTLRHTGSAERPVRGSMMWWTRSPLCRHCLRRVLDVASPVPLPSVTLHGGSPSVS